MYRPVSVLYTLDRQAVGGVLDNIVWPRTQCTRRTCPTHLYAKSRIRWQLPYNGTRTRLRARARSRCVCVCMPATRRNFDPERYDISRQTFRLIFTPVSVKHARTRIHNNAQIINKYNYKYNTTKRTLLALGNFTFTFSCVYAYKLYVDLFIFWKLWFFFSKNYNP